MRFVATSTRHGHRVSLVAVGLVSLASTTATVVAVRALLIILVLSTVGFLVTLCAALLVHLGVGRTTWTAVHVHSCLLEGSLEELRVNLAANRGKKGLDFRELHLLHIFRVRKELGCLGGEHLRGHSTDESVRVVVVALILVVLTGLILTSAILVIIMRVRVSTATTAAIVIIIAFRMTLPLALAATVAGPTLVIAWLVVGVLPVVGTAAVSASVGGGGGVWGVRIRRLKSRHRGGVAARLVDLLEVDWLRSRSLRLLSSAGIVHDCGPVDLFAFKLPIAARSGCCARLGGGLRGRLSRLIHRLSLVLFVRFLGHFFLFFVTGSSLFWVTICDINNFL